MANEDSGLHHKYEAIEEIRLQHQCQAIYDNGLKQQFYAKEYKQISFEYNVRHFMVSYTSNTHKKVAKAKRRHFVIIDPIIKLLWSILTGFSKKQNVRHKRKSLPDSCSGGQALADRHVHFVFRYILREKKQCFYFILTLFDEIQNSGQMT